MKLDTANLGNRSQPLHPVDLQVRLLVAEHGNEFEQVRRPRHGMALEKLLTTNPIRRADNRTGPTFDVVDQPCAHSLMIVRKI
ncbi:hypothetical protein D3C73_956940 [compost metagenome]